MSRILVAIAIASLCATAPAQSPVVPGFATAGTDVSRGLLLLGELGCTSCHAPGSSSAHLLPKSAPNLSRAGERIDGSWMAAFISDPQGLKPGTTMPHAADPADAEAIAHYLVSRTQRRPELKAPDLGAAARGEVLYHQIGCVACHATHRTGTGDKDVSVPLPKGIESKYTHAALARFLSRPLDLRPAGRMPDLKLTGREAHDIAHFLLKDTLVPGSLRYSVFRGRIETLRDFGKLELERTGVTDEFDPELARRGGDFAMRFEGFLNVPTDGQYRFFLRSDDGSRLSIGQKIVVDNDGHRRNQKARDSDGTMKLTRGWHPLEVIYFQRVKNRVLVVEWEGPGLPRSEIPKTSLRSTREPITRPPSFAVDAAKAKRGRDLFAARGCASCHHAERPPAPPGNVPGLGDVRMGHGCLANAATSIAPDFNLSPEQQQAIEAALVFLQNSPADPSPPTRVTRRLTSLNCYACHERDGVGGPSEAKEEWFTSEGHNQGMEGRIPPLLTGVGDKLKRPWLTRVLEEGASMRPLFHTRMPRYGKTNLAGLADALIEADRRPSRPPVVPDDLDAQRTAGRRLLGAVNGFNCIACHHFNGGEGATMQMVDLTDVTDRIHEDWFQRWIRDPGRYRPGTRMPSYLPHQDVLDGDLDRQFAAIWTYLSDGRRALRPPGVSRQSLEIRPGGESIVYRGKLRDVGFRGIAVGHPELAHVAFDAVDLRYALLWKGRFLDVRAHWRSQSMGRIGPRGHDVVKLPTGPSWRLPDGPATTRFRGYRLDETPERRPAFLYTIGEGLDVTDHTRALENAEGIVRSFTLAGAREDGLFLRLAEGTRVQPVERGFRVDGKLTITVGGATAQVEAHGGKKTVLVPIAHDTSELEVTYRW